MLLVGAEVRKDQSLDTAKDELLKTIDELTTKPITKEEVERAQQALLKNIELNLKNTEFIGLTISDWAAQGDWRLLFLHRDRLRKVTPNDVQRVAAAFLKQSNRTVGLYLPADNVPERAEIPRAPNVGELVKDYKGDVPIAVGEEFDPSPANIESRLRRNALPGGLKLALLPKKTRGASVFATVTLRYGDEASLKGRGREASTARGSRSSPLPQGLRRRTGCGRSASRGASRRSRTDRCGRRCPRRAPAPATDTRPHLEDPLPARRAPAPRGGRVHRSSTAPARN